MEDANAELRRLRQELEAANDAFWEEYERVKRVWHFKFGPLRFERAVGSQFITRVYVAFNAICFAVGIVLVVLGGVSGTVGVALIVGSLFAFGSFVAQYWAIVTQEEIDQYNRTGRDVELTKLRHLGVRRAQLIRRLEHYHQTHPGNDANPDG
jgi:hypothetical protein